MDDREKAIALVNAYFDGKDIIMKDPRRGVPDWVSIRHPNYWGYLGMFCRNVDKYKINNVSVNIGDCFYSIDIDFNTIYLIKVTDTEDSAYLTCDEISIDNDEIDHYDTSYHIDTTSDWKPLDINLYENILALLNSKEDAISKIIEQFDNQIRKLCQELNQNQEK